MAVKLWQLYDPQGRPLSARGSRRWDTVVHGQLHASAHLWLWRLEQDQLQVLVQKRARQKVNWPNLFDKSAGGHVLLGEEPIAAVMRKSSDELGAAPDTTAIRFAGVRHWEAPIGDTGLIDNEFQWIYTAEFGVHDIQQNNAEVAEVVWKPFSEFRAETAQAGAKQYVPYGETYYALVCEALLGHASLITNTTAPHQPAAR